MVACQQDLKASEGRCSTLENVTGHLKNGLVYTAIPTLTSTTPWVKLSLGISYDEKNTAVSNLVQHAFFVKLDGRTG